MCIKIICGLLSIVEQLEEEGLLYQDSCHWYSDENYYDYDYISKRVVDIINTIEDTKDQADATVVFIDFCQESEYFYLTYEYLNLIDKSLLIPELIWHDDLKLYSFLKDGLSFQQRMEYLQKFDEQDTTVEIIETYGVYKYLKKCKRIEEMHMLLKDLPTEKRSFFIDYGDQYHEEAVEYFNTAINENLKFTGKNYYRQIADDLIELQRLISQENFTNILQKLKQDYARRPNFIKELNSRF